MSKFAKAEAQKAKKGIQDTNDCTVKAIAITCRVPYEVAWKAAAFVGRKTGKGMQMYQMFAAIKNLGFDVVPVKRMKQKNGCKFTPKTIGQKLKTGYYVCEVSRHVLAVVNGEVQDWTDGRQHHITGAWKVVRSRSRIAEREAAERAMESSEVLHKLDKAKKTPVKTRKRRRRRTANIRLQDLFTFIDAK